MSDSDASWLIGVDGGGTSCRVGLLHRGRRTEVTVGAANVATDRTAAVATIVRGLEAAAAKAGASMRDLRAGRAYLGLAGVMGAADARAVAAQLPLDAATVDDDRTAAVVGALGDDDGAVAGVGTGSFLARKLGADIRLIGGWGLRLDDRASGAWLGRSLLSRILATVDRLEPPTPLTEATFGEFGRDPAAIVAFSLTAAPQDFAAFAPRVVAAAEAGDAAAAGLMNAGADYIARGLAALGWRPDEPLCLIGGVAGHYRARLPAAAARSVRAPRGAALDGALMLAAGLRGGGGAT